jgi:hypothetical protein
MCIYTVLANPIQNVCAAVGIWVGYGKGENNVLGMLCHLGAVCVLFGQNN